MGEAGNGRQFRKIVLTGGPCAGKTTGLSWIQNSFEKMGYTVLFLKEPATEMMTAGITISRCSSPMAYQRFQMKLQYEKEKIFDLAAEDIAFAHPEDASDGGAGREEKEPGPRKVLVVCDRGFFDNCAYMTADEFRQVLEELNVTEQELWAGYDGVFQLETTAKNAAFFYGTENNTVRSETPEEAAALDDRLIGIWSKHPYYRLIENFNGFENKMEQLIAEIATCLGEPIPPEVKHRYLIDCPDTEMLENMEGCQHIEIRQTYVLSTENAEIRIRSQKSGGESIYYLTKHILSGGKRRLDSQQMLSAREYQGLLENADPSKRTLTKNRYRMKWKGQSFSIDLYEIWEDRALLEVALMDEDQEVEFPPFLKIREDVTGDERYEISTLARK